MYIGVKSVKAIDNYKLLLTFINDETREFDMSEYLDRGVFRSLKDKRMFNRVRVNFDFIEWPNGVDFDPELLYESSRVL